MKYRQLSELERYQIDAGIAVGMTIAEIAKRIHRPRSTVFRIQVGIYQACGS